MPNTITHLVSLNIAGGVESLFADYLQHSSSLIQHAIINDRDQIHASIHDKILQHSSSYNTIKYWNNIKLPKKPSLLRQLNFERIPKKNLVIWNKLTDSYIRPSKLPPFVYYDHGSIWHEAHQNTPILNQASKIICVSEAAKFIFENIKGLSNVSVIGNPIRFSKENINQRARTIEGNKEIKLGCAGRLLATKGFRSVIEAMPLLIEEGLPCKLHIAGEGADKNALIKLSQELKVDQHITFHGHLDDITTFYDSLDVFITPSIHEPFGLVTLEAAAHGLPVIASLVDGVTDFIKQEKNGLLIKPRQAIDTDTDPDYKSDSIPPLVFCPEERKLIKPQRLCASDIATSIYRLANEKHLYQSISTNNLKLAPQHSISKYASALDKALLI